MGGTFNPIHYGHLLLAEQALEAFRLDTILLIPSGNSYMKKQDEIASASHRLAMTKLAVEGNPHFTVSDMDMRRSGASYLKDTLLELKANEPNTEFYFLFGADNLFEIEYWKDPAFLFRECTFLLAARGDYDVQTIRLKIEDLEHRFHARIELLPERKIDLSATEIRNRIRNHQSVRYMLPESVIQYIEDNHLYLSSK